MNYDTIKHNFDRGLWAAAMVKKAVQKGIITLEQYIEITGKEESSSNQLPAQEV